eukprot:4149456-Pleurochrysis_carterae.AAC.1
MPAGCDIVRALGECAVTLPPGPQCLCIYVLLLRAICQLSRVTRRSHARAKLASRFLQTMTIHDESCADRMMRGRGGWSMQRRDKSHHTPSQTKQNKTNSNQMELQKLPLQTPAQRCRGACRRASAVDVATATGFHPWRRQLRQL